MWLVLAALAAGVIVGARTQLPESWYRNLDKVMVWTLFAMLAVLGAQIGSNADLLSKLALLGGQALLIGLFSVAGSVLVLWAVARRFGLESRKGDAG